VRFSNLTYTCVFYFKACVINQIRGEYDLQQHSWILSSSLCLFTADFLELADLCLWDDLPKPIADASLAVLCSKCSRC